MRKIYPSTAPGRMSIDEVEKTLFKNMSNKTRVLKKITKLKNCQNDIEIQMKM